MFDRIQPRLAEGSGHGVSLLKNLCGTRPLRNKKGSSRNSVEPCLIAITLDP
ncbi:hypothetical protein L499_A0367 [Bordetella holmesii CDC-H635-BH]|nr:hypothetical protein L499_A0367 [Bordetella holmesii CDC-H635-BH]